MLHKSLLSCSRKVYDEAKHDMATSQTMVIFQWLFCGVNLYFNRQKANDLASLARKFGGHQLFPSKIALTARPSTAPTLNVMGGFRKTVHLVTSSDIKSLRLIILI